MTFVRVVRYRTERRSGRISEWRIKMALAVHCYENSRNADNVRIRFDVNVFLLMFPER